MCIPAAQKRTTKQSNEKIDVFGWAFSFLQKIKGKNKTKHVLWLSSRLDTLSSKYEGQTQAHNMLGGEISKYIGHSVVATWARAEAWHGVALSGARLGADLSG
jgi:hypothetical protein